MRQHWQPSCVPALAIVLDKLKTNTSARQQERERAEEGKWIPQADSPCLACEAGSLYLSLSVCIDSIGKRHPGIPQSVGHIMTFYCVVRRKSAYYACATAFGVDVSGAAFNCGVPGGGVGHGILGTGGGLLKLASCSCCCCCLFVFVCACDCFTN